MCQISRGEKLEPEAGLLCGERWREEEEGGREHRCSSTAELQIGSWLVRTNIASHYGPLPFFSKINPLSHYS